MMESEGEPLQSTQEEALLSSHSGWSWLTRSLVGLCTCSGDLPNRWRNRGVSFGSSFDFDYYQPVAPMQLPRFNEQQQEDTGQTLQKRRSLLSMIPMIGSREKPAHPLPSPDSSRQLLDLDEGEEADAGLMQDDSISLLANRFPGNSSNPSLVPSRSRRSSRASGRPSETSG